jgi:hypothetical protein
MKEEKDN